MRELSEKEIHQVSGAGHVTDWVTGWINERLDTPARNLGSLVGTFAGNLVVEGFHKIISTANELNKGASSFISGIFNR